ncbi:hypothetical protein [Paenibacillus sp. sgz500958]|uniref:TcaA NTF2-like domain-containing protein n=1 Tax=Paenibacillus sp. sgz500958 TaxID=3242475 RepID=UPI0036D24FAC
MKYRYMKCFIMLLLLIMLAGCSKKAEVSNEPSPAPINEQGKENRPVSDIIFTEQEPDHSWDNIEKLMHDYLQHLTLAINKGDFSIVKPELTVGSELYDEQSKLVGNLSSRGITEKLIRSEMYGYSDTDKDDEYDVEMTEVIEIHYPDKAASTKEFHWIYTVKNSGDSFTLSRIKEWPNFAEDMERREGAVKGDGFYVDELMGSYPAILAECLNTLDVTDLREISADESVLEQHKQLAVDLVSLGHNFTVEGEVLDQSWDPYVSKIQLSISYVDFNGKPQEVKRTYQFELDEIRYHFSGYAVIKSFEEISR